MGRVYRKYDYKRLHQANCSTQSNIGKAKDKSQAGRNICSTCERLKDFLLDAIRLFSNHEGKEKQQQRNMHKGLEKTAQLY